MTSIVSISSESNIMPIKQEKDETSFFDDLNASTFSISNESETLLSQIEQEGT